MMRRSGRLATVLVGAALAIALALAGTPAATANPPVTMVKLHGVELDTATVLDLQSHMDKHRFTSAQLTSFYLDRIARLNPELHAVIETNPDALSEAVASDVHRKLEGSRGPLDGVPVLLKDNVGTGDREHTTAGSFALRGDNPAD